MYPKIKKKKQLPTAYCLLLTASWIISGCCANILVDSMDDISRNLFSHEICNSKSRQQLFVRWFRIF